jgi:hypothetical protein
MLEIVEWYNIINNFKGMYIVARVNRHTIANDIIPAVGTFCLLTQQQQ